jgi:5-methyltetrahydrofolate--homocysteine methyltransferase
MSCPAQRRPAAGRRWQSRTFHSRRTNWLAGCATFVEEEGVRIVGGCCGTTPAHIEAIAKAVADAKPAERSPEPEAAVSSLYQAVPYAAGQQLPDRRRALQHERLAQVQTPVRAEGDIEGLVEMASKQVPESHVLDVCVDYVGRDGAPDMEWVVTRFGSDVNCP